MIQRGELREISEVHSIASRVGREQPTSSNLVRTKRSKVLLLASYVASIVALIVFAQYAVSVWKLNRLAELTTIPTFTEQKINYTHTYVNTDTWPAIGGTVFDIEGDGIPEVFVTGAAGQPDLVLSYRDKAVVDVTERVGLSSVAGATYDVHALDVDVDGDDDLLLIRDNNLLLYVNMDGMYQEYSIPISIEKKAVPITVSSGDIDNDGFPDIYISTFIQKSLFKKGTFNDPNHRTANIVLHNNRDYTFSDITQSSGLDFKQNTFYSRFVNIDNDEFVDLVVVPNTDRVQVYKNLGNLKFQRMAPLTDFGFWMGIAVGDVDGDGDEDIFLSNAGRSIPRFLLSGDARGDQPIDIGWRLLRNDGEFIFTDITEKSGVGFDEWAWGSELADFNNDGYLDLVVLENFIDWPIHKVFANPGRLLIQDTQGHFVSTEGRSGVSNRFFGQTPIVVDFNSDNFPDLVYLNQNGPVRVFLNDGRK